MRGLFDVNVLIALLDPDHVFHDRSHIWWAANIIHGWASCPLTENGVVRILSNLNYSRTVAFTPEEVITRLRDFAKQTDHEFWPDDLSFRDDTIFLTDRIHGSKQLTDIYLLALSTHHKGRLVTFDQAIPLSAVRTATAANLCLP